MKNGFALGLVAGIAVALFAGWLTTSTPPAYGQPDQGGSRAEADTATRVLSVPAANGGRFVLIVDTATRVMASYDVSPDDGRIGLRSVRHYEWDLKMDDFNGTEPKPSDVRAIIQQR
jgi:hypothetical protein